MQVKKHIKQGEGHEGGIFTVEAPLHVSNVQILDPVTGYGIAFGFYFDNNCCSFCCFTFVSQKSQGAFAYAGSHVKLELNILKMAVK